MQTTTAMNETQQLKWPFTALFIGATSCGKTQLLTQILLNNETAIQPPPTKIIYLYKVWQFKYDIIKEKLSNITFTTDISNANTVNTGERTLLIFDDFQNEIINNSEVADIFSIGSHHLNISVMLVLQNIFPKGTRVRDITLNCSYFILFKNRRDLNQINILARQMYGFNYKQFIKAYTDATKLNYGYLLVNLKPDSKDGEVLTGNAFNYLPPIKQLEQYQQQITGESNDHSTQSHKQPATQFESTLDTNVQDEASNLVKTQNKQLEVTPQTQFEVTPTQQQQAQLEVTPQQTLNLQTSVIKHAQSSQDSQRKKFKTVHNAQTQHKAYNYLINKAFKSNNVQFQTVFSNLSTAKTNVSINKVRKIVNSRLLNSNLQSFLKLYKKYISNYINFHNNSLHREIINKILLSSTHTDQTVQSILDEYKKQFIKMIQKAD